MSETESKYIFSDILVKGEANTIYEMYERDYSSFQSSKLRAIAYCDRKLSISSKEEDKILFTAIKKELKDNF
jgi:hypothetical protein